ncbi:MAG: chorismate mutase [Pseudomonadota bacterium]|nr:chorismate mutase [Pseudomonadota bacterium]
MIEPEQCKTMVEVRAGVDEVDERIVVLLAVRTRFMDAAARIKEHRDQVRDKPRKAAVIAHARLIVEREGMSPDLVGQVYECLVEASIAYEMMRFDPDWPSAIGSALPTRE